MQHKRSRAMASSRSPFLFVLLALAVGGTANAHDDGLPAFRYSAELLGQLQLPSVALPLNDDLFLYGRDAEAFDLEAYLAVNAPALRDKGEYLEHWSGYYSINPKVLLTLMAMQSGPLGAPDERALAAPLGRLSAKRGFDAQVRDVLQQLSRRYYGFEEYQLRQAAARKAVGEDGLNAASAALLGLLREGAKASAVQGGNPLGAYAQTFQRLFGTPAAELLQPRNRVARQLQAKAALAPPSNLMQLPWRQGYSWQPNGAHSNTGSGYPYSSFDASYDWPRWGSATYSVVAAHAGTVRVLSRCQVRVTHPSGWATNYYHMDQIQVSNGQQVSADTKLGVYAGNINTALCEVAAPPDRTCISRCSTTAPSFPCRAPASVRTGSTSAPATTTTTVAATISTTRAPAPPIALSVRCTTPAWRSESARGPAPAGLRRERNGAEQLARRCRRARRQADRVGRHAQPRRGSRA